MDYINADGRLRGLTGVDYMDALRRVLRDHALSPTFVHHACRMADAVTDYTDEYALDRYDRDRNYVA